MGTCVRLAAVWLLALAFAGCDAGSSARHPRPPPANLPSGIHELIFAVRVDGSDHYYVNFGHYASGLQQAGYREGGQLCRLDLQTGKVTILLDDPRGGVRDPQVHYDGQKILFSYRKGGQPYYHLYEIQRDGTKLRPLTDGLCDDIEPTYLPDGGILFCSSRCNRYVACWYSQVATLYRCDGNGKNIRMISSSIVHDNTPAVLPDGRVLYTRWEYVDRNRQAYHHLWTINPDGTGQMVYFGNMYGGTVMIDAQPIPGSDKIIASFSPGHGSPEHQGVITIVDPNGGPDNPANARAVCTNADFRDPYALAPDCFLVARGRQIVRMDAHGTTNLLYELPASYAPTLTVHEPRPLVRRVREPILVSRVNPQQTTGRVILTDVTNGRSMSGVAPGEIKKLLVLEQLPKPVNFSGTTEPISLEGTFTLKRILGTIPVEPDGSAYAELPALRSLFFVALDAQDLSVKRMQSFVTLQPGETASCAGCHERRETAPPPRPTLAALQRPPSQPTPIPGVPAVLDFPRDIQPILDRRCVACHDVRQRAGGVVLAGDRSSIYSLSYAALLGRKLVAHGADGEGNRPPRAIGSSASPLLQFLDGSHHDVQVPPEERQMIRLWIEVGANYAGTYGALGTGVADKDFEPKRILPPSLFTNRCQSCHLRDNPSTPYPLPLLTPFCVNLSHPEQSSYLAAPLARAAGGLERCRPRAPPGGAPAQAAGTNVPLESAGTAIFASTNDPDYRTILGEIQRVKERLDQMKRFDMPGFRPHDAYLRELQQYGVLPAIPGTNEAIDVYTLDQAYWQSLWYRP